MARPGLLGGQYLPLATEAIGRIHEASLRLLERTGICVRHPGALDVYRRGGAKLDGDRVYIGRGMVEASLASVPHQVVLAGRDLAQDILLEGKRVYAGTGGSPAAVLDPGACHTRPATLSDLRDLALLADALVHCDFFVIPLTPTDIPAASVPANRFYISLRHTTKHVMGGMGTLEGARQVMRMGAILAGGEDALRERPVVSAITSWMVSPLHLDPAVTDILIEWCSRGLPVALSSAPMAGSTSPVTLAGTLAQLNAEQLSGIVLAQLVRPGTPVLAGYIPGVADMRSGGYLGGAVEFGIMQAACAQLAHFYGVPIYGSGGMSDSKLPDAQAGYEKMATLLLAAMGGCNYIHHAIGMVTNMSATSLEQAVLDDDMLGMAMRVLRGLAVQDDTLAVEAIDRVGPGGHFLTDPHTLQHMRSEYFFPRLADRQNRSAWEAEGQQDARTRAAKRAAELLATHEPRGLPPHAEREIRKEFAIVA